MKFIVAYRNEFEAEVEAKTKEEAMEKFEKGECEISPSGDLWSEFFEVYKKQDGVYERAY